MAVAGPRYLDVAATVALYGGIGPFEPDELDEEAVDLLVERRPGLVGAEGDDGGGHDRGLLLIR